MSAAARAELADQLAAVWSTALARHGGLTERFAPDPARLPNVVVHLAPLNAYEDLLGNVLTGDAA